LRPSSFVMWNTPVEVQFTSAECLNYPCRTPPGATQTVQYTLNIEPARVALTAFETAVEDAKLPAPTFGEIVADVQTIKPNFRSRHHPWRLSKRREDRFEASWKASPPGF
jgi:hypothetical protein